MQGYIDNKGSLYRRDCTVRALASATSLPYWTVFEVLAIYGRRPNSGFEIDSWLRKLGHSALRHKFVPSKLGDFGTFLCWNQTHAWVVRDGRILDTWHGSRQRRPIAIFEVIEAGPDQTEKAIMAAEAYVAATREID